MTADSKESALARWSRRKLESQQPRAADEPSLPVEAKIDTPPEVPGDSEAKPVLTDADMPDIESLDENSDYSVFMSEGVSDELRKLALRKLFQSPEFNIRDGLDEYDGDYTHFEKLGDIVTSDMKHQIEMQEQKLREALAEEAEQTREEAAVAEDASEAEIEDDAESVDIAEANPETVSEKESDDAQ